MASGKKKFFISLLIWVNAAAVAQTPVHRYMVFFKDKSGSPYSISDPSGYLSQKAIERRISQGIAITEMDIPVNHSYVSGVRQTGADVFFRSRWFNAALVQCDPSLIPSIEALPYVDHVEFVAPNKKLMGEGRKKFNLRKKNNHTGAQTSAQLTLIGIDHMHEAENKGEGKTIALLDAGFIGVNSAAPFSQLFSEGRIDEPVSYDFVTNTTNVYQFDDHGTNVFSVIAAEVPDAFTGGAPGSNFQLYVTEDVTSEYRIEEYNWVFAAERADSAGVDIINSSLGYYDFDDGSMNYTKPQMDGKTAVVTRAAQWAADRGIVVVCSAGNEGNIPSWRIITAPADAEGVLAVASVDQNGTRSSSSSTGPSADGRIKPDIAAMGVGVKVITPSGMISSASGTSLAAPLITSLVAGVWQRYPSLTNKEVIQVIKQTASLAQEPNNLIGYGIPNFKAVVNYQEHVEQENVFEVFPNPVKDTLIVSPMDPDTVNSCSIELIASNGQILSSKDIIFNWLNRNYQASLRELSNGLYFLRISYQNKKYLFRIVKE